MTASNSTVVNFFSPTSHEKNNFVGTSVVKTVTTISTKRSIDYGGNKLTFLNVWVGCESYLGF